MHFFKWQSGKLEQSTFSERAARQLVLCSLYALRDSYAGQGWILAEPSEAFEALEADDAAIVFVDDKIICLTASRPWFAGETVLSEEFVDPGIPVETVAAVCREVCGLLFIRRFEVGTRAAANSRHAGLAKKYSQAGLTVSTIGLTGTI